MRHRVFGRKLGRNTNQRKALFRGLLRSLILTERLKTSVAKAKAIKGQVDKLISAAKPGTVTARRRSLMILPDKAAVNKLFKELLPRMSKRASGFTRIRRVGRRRGDNSLMAQIEFVDPPQAEPRKNPKLPKEPKK